VSDRWIEVNIHVKNWYDIDGALLKQIEPYKAKAMEKAKKNGYPLRWHFLRERCPILPDMIVTEAQNAAEIVGKNVNPGARIIWGCSIEPENQGTIKVLLIFTGAKSPYVVGRGGEAAMGKLGGKAPKLGQQKSARSPRDSDEGIDFVA
jgi:hypothetical protein